MGPTDGRRPVSLRWARAPIQHGTVMGCVGRRTGVASAFALVFSVRSALAVPSGLAELPACADTTDDGVALEVSGGASNALRSALVQDLYSELAARELILCAGDGEGVHGVVRITFAGDEHALVLVSVGHERARRGVDLRLLPPDGQALALALAADEMLAALPRVVRAAPAAEPPSAPVRSPATSTSSLEQPAGALQALLSGRYYWRASALLGGELAARYPLSQRLNWVLALGGSAALPRQFSHGLISGQGLHARVALGFRWAVRGIDLHPQLGIEGGYWRFRGKAEPGVIGQSAGGSTVALDARLAAEWDLSERLHGIAGAGISLPIRELAVTDNGTVRAGLTRAGVLLYLGASLTP